MAHSGKVARIDAFDLSPKSIAIARENARNAGIDSIHFFEAGFDDFDAKLGDATLRPRLLLRLAAPRPRDRHGARGAVHRRMTPRRKARLQRVHGRLLHDPRRAQGRDDQPAPRDARPGVPQSRPPALRQSDARRDAHGRPVRGRARGADPAVPSPPLRHRAPAALRRRGPAHALPLPRSQEDDGRLAGVRVDRAAADRSRPDALRGRRATCRPTSTSASAASAERPCASLSRRCWHWRSSRACRRNRKRRRSGPRFPSPRADSRSSPAAAATSIS